MIFLLNEMYRKFSDGNKSMTHFTAVLFFSDAQKGVYVPSFWLEEQ